MSLHGLSSVYTCFLISYYKDTSHIELGPTHLIFITSLKDTTNWIHQHIKKYIMAKSDLTPEYKDHSILENLLI